MRAVIGRHPFVKALVGLWQGADGQRVPISAFEETEEEKKRRQANFSRQLYTDEPWQGTKPAEGTRRRTIYLAIGGALTEFEKPEGSFESRASFSLKLADAVESALLHTTIDEEAESPQPHSTEFKQAARALQQAAEHLRAATELP